MDGLLIINKPKTWTSFDVVKKVRGILRVKKVGHTGTLDPMAIGILILCIGQATKLVSKFMAMEKEYVGEITLGATSTTDDADGVITPCHFEPFGSTQGRLRREIPRSTTQAQGISPLSAYGGSVEMTRGGAALCQNDIEKALNSFVGTFDQLPPQYSAKKIEGQRAYKLARAGKTVELKPTSVTVHEIELLDYKWPHLKLRVRCGKGFYMRSLARDLGEKLGCGGYLFALIRTRVGQYSLEQAIPIEQVKESYVLPT